MLTLLMLVPLGFAHSGGTDANGCHAGSRPYHCHGSSSRSRSTPRPTPPPTQSKLLTPTPQPDPDAIVLRARALCANGKVSFNTDTDQVCAINGGVKTWYIHAELREYEHKIGTEGPSNAVYRNGYWFCYEGYVKVDTRCEVDVAWVQAQERAAQKREAERQQAEAAQQARELQRAQAYWDQKNGDFAGGVTFWRRLAWAWPVAGLALGASFGGAAAADPETGVLTSPAGPLVGATLGIGVGLGAAALSIRRSRMFQAELDKSPPRPERYEDLQGESK